VLSRIAQNTKHTISTTIEVEGVPTNATGTPTVTVRSEDGTAIVTDGATTTDATGVYEYALTPTHTADLGLLTATWTATVDAVAQQFVTQHEVVGGHVVSVAEMRRHDPLDDTDAYPTADLLRARDLATYSLERACNRGFTRHAAREVVQPSGSSYLPLRGRLVQSVSAVTVGDTDLDADGLAAVFADRAGYLHRSTGWEGTSSITVTYEHGEQIAHPDVSRAICKIAAEVLFEDELGGEGSAIPDRATSLNTEAGTFSLVTAGVGAAAYDLPEVNRVVQDWRVP
jgi:hypothetical protein